jgi:dipeptidyl aminopeptidase/acylaminoacyl peptidase
MTMLAMSIQQEVHEKTGGMNMSELTPVTFAPKCKTPAFFIHAHNDELVLKDNTERNYAAYGSDQKLVEYVPGGHNDERPKEVIQKVVAFLKANLLA